MNVQLVYSKYFLYFILSIFSLQCSFGQKETNEPYDWKNVQIVGGGFVDGIIFHPNAKGVRYCRTDMGGAYRWNDNAAKWEPMLDWVSYEDFNLMGVESIALDPSNPKMLFMACGTYTDIEAPNAILISDNFGHSFTRVNVPFKMGGNENGRGNGERMAVDPLNGNILYMGTRLSGLWRSTDKGLSWEKVTSFPDVSEQPDLKDPYNKRSGIVFVLYNPKEGNDQGKTATIYVGVSLMNRENLYKSTDGGQTWKPVAGQPTQYRPNHAVMASNGYLLITYGTSPGPSRMANGGIWKLNTKTGEWTEITPDKPDQQNNKAFGYASVSVDAKKPDWIITSTFDRPGNIGGDDIFRSTDGGQTWKNIFGGKGTFDYSLAPYIEHTGIHWMFDIEIDPFDSNHAMFTTGYGGHETFNLTEADNDKPTKWSIMSTGIDETVALELLSPPQGAQLFTAVGDYCGFAHFNLDQPCKEGCYTNPHFNNTNGIACAEKKPEIVVRVGISHSGKHIGYSEDGGKTWQPTDSVPDKDSKLGDIAVSADGKTWIWTPEHSAVYITHNKGAHWTKVNGLPVGIRVIADYENEKCFYAIDIFKGKLYKSTEGGNSFSETTLTLSNGIPKPNSFRGDVRGGQDRIYATPGYSGDLWIPAYDGLYHSTDVGKTFIKTIGVTEIHGFGYGKAAPQSTYPALYLIGVVNGVRGIYRSTDTAKTWTRINDAQHQWGLLLHITGDPKKYGRVYVGTHGRGTMYGDPVERKE